MVQILSNQRTGSRDAIADFPVQAGIDISEGDAAGLEYWAREPSVIRNAYQDDDCYHHFNYTPLCMRRAGDKVALSKA